MRPPTLYDLYHFLLRMHGSEEAAKNSFDLFMAGNMPDGLLQYCRARVNESEETRDQRAGNLAAARHQPGL